MTAREIWERVHVALLPDMTEWAVEDDGPLTDAETCRALLKLDPFQVRADPTPISAFLHPWDPRRTDTSADPRPDPFDPLKNTEIL